VCSVGTIGYKKKSKKLREKPKTQPGLGLNIQLLNETFHLIKFVISYALSFSKQKIIKPKVVINILRALIYN
jgi:hypothetical protein